MKLTSPHEDSDNSIRRHFIIFISKICEVDIVKSNEIKSLGGGSIL